MIFLLTLLGSMIVCDAIVCGDLGKVLMTAARDVHHWHKRMAMRIVASGCNAIGKDYRWE